VLDFAAANPVSLRVIDVSAVLQRRVHQRRRKLVVCGLPDTLRFAQRAALMGIRVYATQHEAVEHALSSVADDRSIGGGNAG
jgi:hypothetical protein